MRTVNPECGATTPWAGQQQFYQFIPKGKLNEIKWEPRRSIWFEISGKDRLEADSLTKNTTRKNKERETETNRKVSQNEGNAK